MTDLPLLGAAMTTATLETLQDFILSENRDLEIQDFCDGDLLNGDWKTVADHTRNLLTGYTCLLYTSPSPRDLSTSRMPSSA